MTHVIAGRRGDRRSSHKPTEHASYPV